MTVRLGTGSCPDVARIPPPCAAQPDPGAEAVVEAAVGCQERKLSKP